MASQGGTMMRPLAVMMKRNPRSISPEATLVEAAAMMRDTRVGAILVGEHGTFIGIVSEADLRTAMQRMSEYVSAQLTRSNVVALRAGPAR